MDCRTDFHWWRGIRTRLSRYTLWNPLSSIFHVLAVYRVHSYFFRHTLNRIDPVLDKQKTQTVALRYQFLSKRTFQGASKLSKRQSRCRLFLLPQHISNATLPNQPHTHFAKRKPSFQKTNGATKCMRPSSTTCGYIPAKDWQRSSPHPLQQHALPHYLSVQPVNSPKNSLQLPVQKFSSRLHNLFLSLP